MTTLPLSGYRTRTVADWMERLEVHDVLCAPLNRYADLPRDPQIVASRLIVEREHPARRALSHLGHADPVRPDAWRNQDTRARAQRAHRRRADEAGLTPAEIAGLRKSGTIR